MIPHIKKCLLSYTRAGTSRKHCRRLPPLNEKKLMNIENQNGIWLTMKNYGAEKGVSTAIHNSKNHSFFMKGPVGKSMFDDVNDLNNLHVAFTAGTGGLVFIDLVMRIFIQNYS
jgi:hypothetical protein